MYRTARRTIALALTLLAASTARVESQICAGFPAADGQLNAGGGVHFPDDARQYGAEIGYNVHGPFAAAIGIARHVSSASGGADATIFAGTLAADFSIPGTLRRPFFSICPLASIHAGDRASVLDREVRLGAGFGSSIPLGLTGRALMPYVVPSFVWRRRSGLDDGSTYDGDFEVRAGTLVGFGAFYVGGELRRIFDDAPHTVLGVRAGFRVDVTSPRRADEFRSSARDRRETSPPPRAPPRHPR